MRTVLDRTARCPRRGPDRVGAVACPDGDPGVGEVCVVWVPDDLRGVRPSEPGHGPLPVSRARMTPAQEIALRYPCYLAGETINPIFGHRNGRWSLVLSVNAGYE